MKSIFSVLIFSTAIIIPNPGAAEKICSLEEEDSSQTCISIKFPWEIKPAYFCSGNGTFNYTRPACADAQLNTSGSLCNGDNRDDGLKVATPWDSGCCPYVSNPITAQPKVEPLLIMVLNPSHLNSYEYDYDFDFESAVTSGLLPNSSRTDYNESSDSRIHSSPGCPKPYKRDPWLLYGNPPKCYLSDFRGPCSENMKLFPQSRSVYGYCGCNCYSRSSESPYCLGYTSNGKKRILSYSKENDTCPPLFEQGGCAEGDWTVLGENPMLGPICEKRRCPVLESVWDDSYNPQFSFYDYQTKSCNNVGDTCTTTIIRNFGTNNHYVLKDEDWIPICQDKPSSSQSSGIKSTGCHPTKEKFSTILQKCVPAQGSKGSSIG